MQDYACGSRAGVVLRFGTIVGDDPMTRFQLRAVRHGHPIGLGSPDGWAHVVHTDDLGPAVLAALTRPAGSTTSAPSRCAGSSWSPATPRLAGRESIDFMGPFMRRMGGVRLEPLARSLRVSSDHFTAQTGWTPAAPHFDPRGSPTPAHRRDAGGAADEPPTPARPEQPRELTDAERRRRRARVFGDVLPDSTSDERGDDGATGRRERRVVPPQVPPHHG